MESGERYAALCEGQWEGRRHLYYNEEVGTGVGGENSHGLRRGDLICEQLGEKGVKEKKLTNQESRGERGGKQTTQEKKGWTYPLRSRDSSHTERGGKGTLLRAPGRRA